MLTLLVLQPQMNNTNATQSHPFRAQRSNEEHTADSLAAGWEKRSVQEALDEIAREIGVRERCFPKWIQDTKVSSSDAKDRLQRLIKAAQLIQVLLDTQAEADA